MSKKGIHAFIDCDLDGAGAYHTLTTILQQKMTYTVTRVVDADVKILAWLSKNNPADYEKIYILDLDVSQHETLIEQIDLPNVTIIDHHKTHVQNRNKYKRAETLISLETSTCKMIYKHYDGKNQLSDQFKKLVLMVDDYDSYQLKIPDP